MTIMSRIPVKHALLAAGIALAAPLPASAQSIGYDNVSGGGDSAAAPAKENRSKRTRVLGGDGGPRVDITPYIEAMQVVTAELEPGDDVFTYSRLAAGVDGQAIGRNNGVSLSVRYERQISWDDHTDDGDVISGVLNGYTTVAPGVIIQAGALATRARVDESGGALPNPFGQDDSITQVYSAYAGPSVSTYAGDVGINASYRIGYTKVEQPDAFAVIPGGAPVDVFDESVVHVADVQAGVAPGTVLPVGLGVGSSYYREDVSNLDQRVEDFSARAMVTVPVTHTVQATGAVGYEKVEISSRDALRDGNGDPVIGGNGHYVTDKSAPRVLAYDVDGLIWDVGVMWRPSTRTSLTAHVGKRYGSTSYTGTFSYAPSRRSAINIAVYDNVAGFGGQINRALADLPTDFEAIRNPLTGDLGGCVSSLEGGNCLAGMLGSLRSSTFRARGVVATYGYDFGRLETGIGAGYDRRKFIGATGTILGASNGVIDENYWIAAYLNGIIDNRSSFGTNLYANWIETGGVFGDDISSIGATASYYRDLIAGLSATAAVGVDGVNRSAALEDYWSASALLGVRYSF
ncbi:MAG TPA: preprotein translocase subunit YajC [Novosphingobium sp.]|nr:preprotein translocase subunit YajC [Novosphingobium sp.]